MADSTPSQNDAQDTDFISRHVRDASILAVIVLDSHLRGYIDRLCRRGSPALTTAEMYQIRLAGIRGLPVDQALVDRAALDPREDHPYASAKRLLHETQKVMTQDRHSGTGNAP